MNQLVFDASAALSLLVKSQSTPRSLALAETLDAYELIAPDIFGWEVTNVLLALARRSSLFDLDEGLEILSSMAIELEHPLLHGEIEDLTLLARQCQLSLFDAAYLHLALSTGAALASRDRKLLDAAVQNKLAVLDLGETNLDA